jgi:glycosyltransferase involved in cell wall biosynthesis
MTRHGTSPRILHVSQPTAAGVAVTVHNLVRHQRACSLDVHLACPDDGWLGSRSLDAGVPVHSWPSSRSPGPSLLGEVRSLRRIIDALDPDVVHLHSSKAGLAGRLVLRGNHLTVFEPNAWSFHPTGPTQPLARRWECSAGRWTDLYIIISQAEADLGRAAGIRGEFVVVPHGVDPSVYTVADDADRTRARVALALADVPTAVCVGRLCEQKGQDLLFQAWPLVLEQVPEAQLVLVGDGPDGAGLLADAPQRVHFAGNRSDIRSWLAAADLAVSPSRWEAGISIANLEAWSVGRPVVSFDMMGMDTEIGGAGAAVPMGDVNAFAAETARRLADPELCTKEGRIGRQRIEDELSEERSVATVTEHTLALLAERAER